MALDRRRSDSRRRRAPPGSRCAESADIGGIVQTQVVDFDQHSSEEKPSRTVLLTSQTGLRSGLRSGLRVTSMADD